MSQRIIYLAPSEPQCLPSNLCGARNSCARYLVAPTMYRPMFDGTWDWPSGACSDESYDCPNYLDASKHRPAPVQERKVYEAPDGLFA